MTQPNLEVQAASAAFGRGDLAALQDQFLAENIVWHLAGTGPLAGDYQGVAQVMGMLGRISELSGGTIQHELHDVLVSNDHTVVLATIRAQRAGKQLQDNIVHVIHGENGKATEGLVPFIRSLRGSSLLVVARGGAGRFRATSSQSS